MAALHFVFVMFTSAGMKRLMFAIRQVWVHGSGNSKTVGVTNINYHCAAVLRTRATRFTSAARRSSSHHRQSLPARATRRAHVDSITPPAPVASVTRAEDAAVAALPPPSQPHPPPRPIPPTPPPSSATRTQVLGAFHPTVYCESEV